MGWSSGNDIWRLIFSYRDGWEGGDTIARKDTSIDRYPYILYI